MAWTPDSHPIPASTGNEALGRNCEPLDAGSMGQDSNAVAHIPCQRPHLHVFFITAAEQDTAE